MAKYKLYKIQIDINNTFLWYVSNIWKQGSMTAYILNYPGTAFYVFRVCGDKAFLL